VKTLGKQEEQKPSACPGAAHIPFHEITIHFGNPPPAKLALVLEGERKVDECRRPAEAPPIVKLERRSGYAMVVTVQHFGAYQELPRDVSFRLLDLGDCSEPEGKEVLAVSRLPLVFETDFPNGPKCAGRTYARVQLIKQ
jgi:hypothetical protein